MKYRLNLILEREFIVHICLQKIEIPSADSSTKNNNQNVRMLNKKQQVLRKTPPQKTKLEVRGPHGVSLSRDAFFFK